jgi:PmbA protein
VVHRHINEVKFCYEQQLNARPDLQGRVTTKFVISPTGSVQSAMIGSSDLRNEAVESCIVRAVRRWTFPAPDGGGVVVVNYPFLLDAAGLWVFPDWFSISERPHLPRALASAPFDHEGVATHDRELVSGGVLLGYVLGTYSARKLGLRTTGNAGGTHNLIVHGRGRDLDGMLALMDRGLFVTELMGQGVNGVTGDYSRGAAGFWVEGGRLVHPVHEVTVAGNLRDIYKGIVDVGADVDLRGGIRTGSVLVERMTVAGA